MPTNNKDTANGSSSFTLYMILILLPTIRFWSLVLWINLDMLFVSIMYIRSHYTSVLDPVIMTIMIIMFYISYFKTKSYGKLLIIKNSLPWGSSFCCLDHAERQDGAQVLVLGRTKLCFQSKEGPSAFVEKKKKTEKFE